MITIVNIVSAVIAVLIALSTEPIIPIEVAPWLLLVVAVLSQVRDFLKQRLPASLAFLAK